MENAHLSKSITQPYFVSDSRTVQKASLRNIIIKWREKNTKQNLFHAIEITNYFVFQICLSCLQ